MELADIYRRYLEVLVESETMSFAQVIDEQTALLERLCRHARQTTRFYEGRLAPLFDRHDRFAPERWCEVPPLTREEANVERDALISNAPPKNFGRILEAKTSGSTGEPVRVLKNDTQRLTSACIFDRLVRWHGLDPTGKLARVASLTITDDPATKSWSNAHWTRLHRKIDMKGPVVGRNGQLPVPDLTNWLERERPDCLVIAPRHALAIANEYRQRAVAPGYRLKAIIAYGETRTPELDAGIKEVFGVAPISLYTSEEVGHIAVECPQSGLYHVAEEVMRVDVVDTDGRDQKPGELGRVLTTPLYAYAMPLIKYEIGDETSLAENGASSRPFTALSPIQGRIGNLFRHADGHGFRPSRFLFKEIATRMGAVAIQIAQTGIDHVVVRYKPGPAASDNQAEIAELVKKGFGASWTVDFVEVDQIPTRANGKREDFVFEDGPPDPETVRVSAA
ncbi:MAG: hypothetical protein AAF661_10125 [Pseudomonadota bacterium]